MSSTAVLIIDGDLTPGTINLDCARNSSTVMPLRHFGVSAMPGNLAVYTASQCFFTAGLIGVLYMPVSTVFGTDNALGHCIGSPLFRAQCKNEKILKTASECVCFPARIIFPVEKIKILPSLVVTLKWQKGDDVSWLDTIFIRGESSSWDDGRPSSVSRIMFCSDWCRDA